MCRLMVAFRRWASGERLPRRLPTPTSPAIRGRLLRQSLRRAGSTDSWHSSQQCAGIEVGSDTSAWLAPRKGPLKQEEIAIESE